MNMNPYYVSSFFKAQTGERFSDYVIRIKMETAERLLMNRKTVFLKLAIRLATATPTIFRVLFASILDILRGNTVFINCKKRNEASNGRYA